MFDIFDPDGVFIAKKSLKDFSRPNNLTGRFKGNHFYCAYQQESGFYNISFFRVIWKKL